MSGPNIENLIAKLPPFAQNLLGKARSLWGERYYWWSKKRVRWGAYGICGLLFLLIMGWFLLIRDLPSNERLKTLQPLNPTTVRSIDGTPIHSYAREHRIPLSYNEFPHQLVYAYLAAEDHNFFQHNGIDYQGVLVAAVGNITRSSRAHGASTITQQVIKNLILTNEFSYTRKVKEAILAQRIESVLTKQQILELYLNQIALGRNAYGVQAAARAYFNKDVKELTLAQCAFLATLPKSPVNFNPDTHMDRAMGRRAYVLNEMLRYNFINRAQYIQAMAEPLVVIKRDTIVDTRTNGYFLEEVRRILVNKYHDEDENGKYPNSVYGGGLWVRTSYNPELQGYAESALRDGLVRYDHGHGWSGPLRHIEVGDGWNARLAAANLTAGYPDWKSVLVLDKTGSVATIGFADGSTAKFPAWAAALNDQTTNQSAYNMLKPGDVIAVKAEGRNWILRNIPKISGAMVVEDPHTGRVLAMQGGFDSQIQTFNRATQAIRQPGSSFKPFVYASAMDHGMTPATMIMDGEFCVYQSAKLGKKCFKNFGGEGGNGLHTLRWGVEQSRNLMTVRAASETGMDNIANMAEAVGISRKGHKYRPVLAIALGAGETTVARMVNAYAVLDNNGRETRQSLIDYVQDRLGKVIYRADTRPCLRCNAKDWDGKPMPRPAPLTKQLIDAQSAYQTVHIMEGVIQNGTAVGLKDLNRPLFGKTGTTSGPKEVWFIGGSPDLIAGIYMGYDKPKDMGSYAQGGTLAVPIFKDFAEKAMKNMPVTPFHAAPGIHMVRIARATGARVFGAWPSSALDSDVIWEAFKPDSEPVRSTRRDELPVRKAAPRTAIHHQEQASQASAASGETPQTNSGIY